MKKLITLSLIIFAFAATAFAQSSLGITNFTGVPATLTSGSTYYYSVDVKNYGTAQFNGNIKLITGIKNGSSIKRIDSTIQAATSFNGGSTIKINQSPTYTTNNNTYNLGINIVVIWPVSDQPNFTTKDSLTYSVFLNPENTGISDLNLKELISVYPNPVKSNVTISSTSFSDKAIEVVNIKDVTGKLLNSFTKPTTVDMNAYNDGMYLFEIIFSDNATVTYRVLKQ